MINLTNPLRLVARRPRLSRFVVLAVVLVVARNAAAMNTYPAEIQTHLGLNYTPPCTLCHATMAGGGPMATKFGQSMVAAGLTVNFATLDTALDTLNKNQTDSDGDGVPDIQALKAGLDPSTGSNSVPAERYGCGARISTGTVQKRGELSIALAALSLGLLVHRRRILKRNAQSR
jgi:hypothetical protein